MATTKRRKQDTRRVSSQKHEIGYTGGKVARSTGSTRRAGKKAVKRAKSATGTVSRRPVERKAKEIAPAMERSKRCSRAPSTRSRGTAGAKRTRGVSRKRGGRSQNRSQNLSRMTTDHDEIRRWAEERGAHPAAVKRTSGRRSDVGIIRLDFPGFSGGQSLQEISWDEFFEKFDDSNLALVYQEHTADGERSNFNKLVKRK